jgi:hypothetical protein
MPTAAGTGYGSNRDKDTFASPPVPPQKARPSHGLRSGMQVFHNKFGEGTVHRAGRLGRRCARAGQVRAPRRQVAGAVGGQAHADLSCY